MPLAAVAQQRADCDLDYARFIGYKAADRVGTEVPALRQFADGVVLIVRNAIPPKLATTSREC
jgi:hypothetical protein